MSGAPWLGEGRSAWFAEVEAWVRKVVPASGAGTVTDLQSVKERPWGAVLRVVTPTGPLYVKVPGPVSRHELTLVASLGPRWPTLAPRLIAADATRGWMLLADHGDPMSDVLDLPSQVRVFEGLLPAYADMQAATTADLPAWLAAGTTDRRVGLVPAALDQLLDGASPIGALTLDDAEQAGYRAGLPELERVCADLASTPTPDALDHADLHGTNVLVREADHCVSDWGDACITHPYATLFVCNEHVVRLLPGPDRRAATLRLRDAYLEPWGQPPSDREVFGLSVWVAHISRAMNIAHAAEGNAGDHSEITSLLRQWHAKRRWLGRPDDVIQPI